MIPPRLREQIEDRNVRQAIDILENNLTNLQEKYNHLSIKLDRAYNILLFFCVVNILLTVFIYLKLS